MSSNGPSARPTVRRAVPDDSAALALVGGATFLESYAVSHSGPNIVRHCEKFHTEQVYAQWLRDDAFALWVATVGDGTAIVGYAALTPTDLPNAESTDLELRRIYILSRFQGNGTGRALIERVAEEARRRGAKRLMLGVYGENASAKSFYEYCGFREIGTRTFMVGDMTCYDFVLGLDL